jgi:hypothetical protein
MAEFGSSYLTNSVNYYANVQIISYCALTK